MIITKSREYTVNMGNYESLKFGASVTLDTTDVDISANNPSFEECVQWVEDRLTAVLAEDMSEARVLTNTKDSYILSWKEK